MRDGRAGETAADLAKRTGTHWSEEQVAVVNAMEAGERLKAARPVKVGIQQPYTPRD